MQWIECSRNIQQLQWQDRGHLNRLSRVLAKIVQDRANVWLVCAQPECLRDLDRHRIARMPVPAAWNLWSGSGPMVTPSSVVPACAALGGWQTPLQVMLIGWGR